MEKNSPSEANDPQLVKKCPEFNGIWRFIMFTRVHHLYLSCVRWIQCMPSQFISLRLILILSFQLCLGLPSGLFLPNFPTATLHTFQVSPKCATCPTHLAFLFLTLKKLNSMALVCARTIPTEWPPPVSEVSANFCGWRGVTWSAQRVPTAVNLCFLDLEPLLFSFK